MEVFQRVEDLQVRFQVEEMKKKVCWVEVAVWFDEYFGLVFGLMRVVHEFVFQNLGVGYIPEYYQSHLLR